MHKLSEDKTQVTFTVPDFSYGDSDSMSATVVQEFKQPFEYGVLISIHMEDERMPCEALEEFFNKTVEITCDIDPEWGELTSKPSMIQIVK